VVGTPGLLQYLRDIGFQTFAPVVDESYDRISDNHARMRHIWSVIESIGNMSRDDLRGLRETLQPIVAHNLRHLQTMSTPMERLLAEICEALEARSPPV
jgi:hypothetical protein